MGKFEPGGALVVEIRERAFLEAGIFGGGGHDGGLADQGESLGWDVFKLIGGVDAVGERLEPFEGIEPAFAEIVEFFRGFADALVGGVVDGLFGGRPREREGFKAHCGAISRIIAQAVRRCLSQSPAFVNAALECAEEIIVLPREHKKPAVGKYG